MKQGLAEINELEGVWGSFLCKNNGEIIASAPPPGVNQATLENIARHCVELLTGGTEHIQDLQEVVIHLQNRKLFFLDLQQVILIVICTPKIDISLLRLTINIVTTRWEGDAEVQDQLSKNFVERI